MEHGRRQKYLKALGIETWELRGSGEEPAAEKSAPAIAQLADTAPPATPAPKPRIKTPRAEAVAIERPAVAPPPAAVQAPRDVATDWTGLRAQVSNCQHCKLCATRANTVFGVGHEQSPLMVVGEGPGADEDAQGEPFVGRAGKLLDQMLKAIGVSRTASDPSRAVFIANVVKCRPPGNRDPEPDEVEACRPYLDRQIELVRPKLIVALGRIAAQRLLDTDAPLSKLRGPVHQYGPTQTPLVITYHPAYLLRSPREKAKSWQDLKAIHRMLQANP